MKHNKIPKDTICEISWLDTSTTADWTSPEDIDKATPVIVKTVGYYHGCKRIGGKVRWITLKHNLCSDGNADFTTIVFGSIIKMERIE
jgi:hypothetical protein